MMTINLLGAIPDKYLRCRTFGHEWEPAAPIYVTSTKTKCVFLVCTSCGSERADDLERSGEIYRRNYYYPDDYDRYTGYTRADYRKEYLLRQGKPQRRVKTKKEARA